MMPRSHHAAVRRSACIFIVMLGVAMLSSTALAQPNVRAKVQPSSVAQGDYLNYTISVSVQGNQKIEIHGRPDFGSAFQVVGTTNAPSHVIHNGNVQKSLRRIYRLRALEEGSHTIRPPRVRVGGSEHRANRVSVRVRAADDTARSRRKSPRHNASRQRDERVFLDHELEPTRTPYVGEQLTLTYYLYADAFRLKIDPQPPHEPSLDDFWTEDLSQNSAGQRQTMRINGRVMERMNMRTYALFPLRAGPTSIDSLAIDVHTGGFGLRRQKLRLESDPIELDVQPLPANAPDSFYEGNVGQWRFRVTADRTRAPMGRAITLEVTAEGEGQVGRIELPELPELDGARIAGQNEKVDRKIESGIVGGSKTLEYTLVAEREGTLEIPALEFSYFDPETEAYQTTRSEPIAIEIKGGEVSLAKKEPPRRERAERADEPDLLDTLIEALAAPKVEVSLEPADRPLRERTLVWILLLIPLIGTLAVWLERPLRKFLARSRPGRRRGAAYKKAMSKLDQAEDEPPTEALELIRDALTTYLVDVAGLPAGAISQSALPGHLEKRGVDAELAERLAQMVGGFSDARYSPDIDTKSARVDELRRECRACLEQLEERRRRKSWKPAAAAAMLLAAAVGASVLLAPVEAKAADETTNAAASSTSETTQTLEEAKAAAQDGRWAEAARLWTEVVDAHPKAPDALYNLGTALAHTGDFGGARLMLERASFYAPGDLQIENNRASLEQIVRLRQIEHSPGTVHDNTTSEGLFWWRLATSISSRALVTALIVLVWLLFVASLTRRVVGHRAIRDAALVASVLAAIGVALVVGSCFARAKIVDTVHPAVITKQDTPLREGPTQHAGIADVRTLLVPGVVLPVRDERDGWVKLAFSDGTTAWAPRANVEMIVEGVSHD